MAEVISKSYDYAKSESEVVRRWVDARAFEIAPDAREGRYVIMMPLPNVTGALHMGHAMDNVMQDLLIRWHRMKGENTLWQPGTDHAGIATQAVVEKRLLEFEGKTRHDIGREGLVQRIWDWKDECQSRIILQQQGMGCSCDWSRQRFTMDRVCQAAVRQAFFRLFRDRLVYRGVRLVNWDSHLQTAISDDEIVTEVTQGHFWYIRYPVHEPKPGEPEHLVVATTRPETMLGDTAVACHPDPAGALDKLIEETGEKVKAASAKDRPGVEDELKRLKERRETHLPRLEKLRAMAKDGREVVLPLQNKRMPLILDEWAKPELGSGCVKITPAHDHNDYAVWERHSEEIGLVNILNPDGTLNENAGRFKGLSVPDARKAVVKALEGEGLLDSIEDREIPLACSDRSKTPIEPFMSEQWFIRMGDVEGGVRMGEGTDKPFNAPGLAQAAIDAVGGSWRSSTGRNLVFHPDADRYAGMYLNWLKEKRDWCISRQLWWGHRIPIWTAELDAGEIAGIIEACSKPGPDRACVHVFDESGKLVPEASLKDGGAKGKLKVQLCILDGETEGALDKVLKAHGFEQDPDVLDTWFSSSLWPFSTLGWPDPETAKIEKGQAPLRAGKDAPNALDYYYPGSCLVTGRDIITLWVARMVVMGLYCLGDMPFTDSFIHANILDGKGERMSKSKGNGIDPLDIIERYGADALRYVLCEMQSGTQDIRLPVQAESPFTGKLLDLSKLKSGRSIFTKVCPDSGKEFDILGTLPDLPRAKLVSERFQVGKAFCIKLWNASRFAFMNLGKHEYRPLKPAELAVEDRWVVSRLNSAVEEVDKQLAAYNPSAAIGAIREFFWGDFCDWYIEIVKPRLSGGGDDPAPQIVALILDQILRLLHPFLPFITETLWKELDKLAPKRGLETPLEKTELLAHAKWPEADKERRALEVEGSFDLIRKVVRGIREIRAKYSVPPKKELPVLIQSPASARKALDELRSVVASQGRVSSLEIAEELSASGTAATQVVGAYKIYVDGVLDPVKERERLDKRREQLSRQADASKKRLANAGFTDRAPQAVVDKERRKLEESLQQLSAIESQIKALPS